QLGHAATFGDHGRFRTRDAGRLEHAVEHVDHQRGGDEIEHDGGDHHMAAALGLEVARNEGPEAAKQRRRQQGSGSDDQPMGILQGQGDDDDTKPGHIGLAIATDIEQATMRRNGDGKAGEDEIGGVIERIADVVAIAEGAGDDGPDGGDRVLADHQHDEARHQNGQQQVEQRQEGNISPARQGTERAHDTGLSSTTPAIIRPSWPSVAVAGSASPTILPSNITRMRSARERISSSSTETSRIALPASRILMIWLWMNSMAPISTPRVGWPTTSTSGSRSISRASTIFCWLPPEN